MRQHLSHQKRKPKRLPLGFLRYKILGRESNSNLNHCQNIVDVSALGNIQTLDLSNCKNITDVSALCNVHTLYLYGCGNLIHTIDELQVILKNTTIHY